MKKRDQKISRYSPFKKMGKDIYEPFPHPQGQGDSGYIYVYCM
jgi:hypothetical protein